MHEMTEPTQPEYELRAKLYTKLHAVMTDVAYIKRDAKNDFHGYKYASEAAIKSAIHQALVKHGVQFMLAVVDVQERESAPTKGGKAQWITRALMEFEFTDIATGYSIAKQFAGQGIDGEDKGLYKAITGGLKYALTSSFLIETGDDPEGETDQGQRMKAARMRSIENVAQKVGDGDKGYDKKAALESIARERDRLLETLGQERGQAVLKNVLRKHGWVTIDDHIDNAAEARALYKALAVARIEESDEQGEAQPATQPAPKQPVRDKPVTTGKFAYLADFKALKEKHGEDRYRAALGRAGWEKSNLIPPNDRKKVLDEVAEDLAAGHAVAQEKW